MPARELTADQRRFRSSILGYLSLEPAFSVRLGSILESAVDEAPRSSSAGLAVLDAGCGHKSPLAPLRGRIDRLVGADIHEPDRRIRHLDQFVVTDLCERESAFDDKAFGMIVSNFTIEHLRDPSAAIVNFARWLQPDGVLVITTVNRRHPFVCGYLSLPPRLRRAFQRSIKASDADAHPLVGSCNEPATIRKAMAEAGFERIEIETVGNLARAWSRRWPTFALGAVGDLLANAHPSRRSTIIATARRGPTAL